MFVLAILILSVVSFIVRDRFEKDSRYEEIDEAFAPSQKVEGGDGYAKV